MEAGSQDKSTLYDLLGVSRRATPEEIREAFIKIARVQHPDARSDEDAAEAMKLHFEGESATRTFKRVTLAYHILSDQKRREEYDQTLPHDNSLLKDLNRKRANGVFGTIEPELRSPLVTGEENVESIVNPHGASADLYGFGIRILLGLSGAMIIALILGRAGIL